MALGVQIIGILFGLAIAYITFLHYKKKEFTLNETAFWTLFGAGFVAISIYPKVLDFIVRKINFARTLDMYIVFGFIFLIAATYHTYTVTRKTQKRMEELVRKIAINKK